MDTIDYATKIKHEFGIDLSDAIKMLDMEADDIRSDNFHSDRKLGYSRALESAYEHI